MTDAPSKRRYNSTRRSEQAARTRRDILDAAIASFSASGWSGTTLTGIATDAGVAVETVYGAFKNKRQLLRRAIEVAVVGDDADVPLLEREEMRRLETGSVDERLAAGVQIVADIHERTAGLAPALDEAAAADPGVASIRDDLEAGRRTEIARSLENIFGHTVDDAVVDLTWVLMGPHSYIALTRNAGWDRSKWQIEVATAVRRLVGGG